MKTWFKPQTKKEKAVFWTLWSFAIGLDLAGVLFHQPFLTGVGMGLLFVSVVSTASLRRKYRMRG
jgi:hypothetical protein